MIYQTSNYPGGVCEGDGEGFPPFWEIVKVKNWWFA
jgi:hypothetical protein